MLRKLTFSSFLLFSAFCAWASAQANSASKTFGKVRELLSRGEYAQGAAMLDQLDVSHLLPLERFNAGWLYGQTRRFDSALRAFQSVSDDLPDRVTHSYAVALCHFQLHHYAAVVDLLQPLINEPGFSSKQQNLLGVAYSKSGQTQQALNTFRLATNGSPADIAAYLNTVTLLCENGLAKDCQAAAAQTVYAFPSSAEAHIVYGAAYLENGHLEESRTEFQSARKLDSQSPEAAFFLGLAEYRQNDFTDAIACLQSAIKEGAADADVHYLLAECLLRQLPDDTAGALAELDQALRLNPKSVPSLTTRGKLYLQAKDYSRAVTDLELALTQDADSRSTLYTLARAYQAMGKPDRARELRARISKGSDEPLADLGKARLSTVLSGTERSQ